ncbi:MAG: ADP-ribosyltransferase [Silvanigrellaceae bacterium]
MRSPFHRLFPRIHLATSFLLLVLFVLQACKPVAKSGLESDVSSVPACTVWPEHFMVTKDNIPVFASPDDLEANKNAKYVGKGTPVIRELTMVSDEKNVRVMRIVVRGGTLAGENRWYTLAVNLAHRTPKVCPENTPRKCGEFAVHYCDGSGCRCIDTGAAPEDPWGNLAIDTVATLGLGSVKSLGFLLVTRINAVRAVPAAVNSVPTVFSNTSLNLTRHIASEPTLLKVEEFLASAQMHSWRAAKELIGKNRYYLKLDVSELGALNYYTRMGYTPINNALRSGNQAELAALRPVIEAASSGLTKLSEKAFQGVVYRGISLSDELSAVYKVGANVTEKAFTSTTRNAGERFAGNTIFQITSKSGRMIDEISEFKNEMEVLFPPGTVFKVVSRGVETLRGRLVTRIVMEQVP